MKLYIHTSHDVFLYDAMEGEIIAEMLVRVGNGKEYEALLHNRPVLNKTMLVSSLFNEGDSVVLKELAPQPLKATKYTPITKYTFYELDDMNVRIIVELKDIEKVPMEQFHVRFFERSFEIRIHNYKGDNWSFGCARTQCSINVQQSKISTKNGKLLITIRKVKKDDNWFSIYKQKTIGGDDSD